MQASDIIGDKAHKNDMGTKQTDDGCLGMQKGTSSSISRTEDESTRSGGIHNEVDHTSVIIQAQGMIAPFHPTTYSSTSTIKHAKSGTTPTEKCLGLKSTIQDEVEKPSQCSGRTEPIQSITRRLYSRESLNRDSENTRARKKRANISSLNCMINQLQSETSLEKKPAQMVSKSERPQKIEVVTPGSCSICYCNWDSQITIGKLGCGHGFCFNCINRWSTQSNLCPLCKEKFLAIQHQTGQGDLIEDVLVRDPNPLDLEDFDGNQDLDQESSSLTEPVRDPMLDAADDFCYACDLKEDQDVMLVCDHCSKKGCHTFCLRPPLKIIPDAPWYCDFCVYKYKIRTTLPIAKVIKGMKRKTTKPKRSGGNKKGKRAKKQGPIARRTPIPGSSNQPEVQDPIITSDEEFEEDDMESSVESEDEELFSESNQDEEEYQSDPHESEESSESDDFVVTTLPKPICRSRIEPDEKPRNRLRKSSELLQISKVRMNQRLIQRKKFQTNRLKENPSALQNKYMVNLESDSRTPRTRGLVRLTRPDSASRSNHATPKREFQSTTKKFLRLRKGSNQKAAPIVKRKIFSLDEEDVDVAPLPQTIQTRRMKEHQHQRWPGAHGAQISQGLAKQYSIYLSGSKRHLTDDSSTNNDLIQLLTVPKKPAK